MLFEQVYLIFTNFLPCVHFRSTYFKVFPIKDLSFRISFKRTNIYEYIHFQKSSFHQFGWTLSSQAAAGESGSLASYLKSPPRAFPTPERKRIRLIKDTECGKTSTAGPKPAVPLVSGRGSSESVSIDSRVKTLQQKQMFTVCVYSLLKNVSGGTQRTFLLFTCWIF